MYQARRHARSDFIPIRNLNYHVLVWGEPAAHRTPLVMLHGWMDVAASFQFVVDALDDDQYIVAPDWRGFGQSGGQIGRKGDDGPDTDSFWFPDYLADLDFLLDHYAPGQPVNLVGHSMGGNVAMIYAGVRPERVRRLVNLEGFGMPSSVPAQAAGRYAKWMDELRKLHRGELTMHTYDSAEGVARRLMKTNPRLSGDKAQWLARRWARENAQGQWTIQGHPAHKMGNAQLYRLDEVLTIFQRITTPVLHVEATQSSLDDWYKGTYRLEQFHERLKSVPDVTIERMADAGHMLHHDQPEALARLIAGFIGKGSDLK
jgi:pimeloyl-ACP methyl ester carboxylesterase